MVAIVGEEEQEKGLFTERKPLSDDVMQSAKSPMVELDPGLFISIDAIGDIVRLYAKKEETVFLIITMIYGRQFMLAGQDAESFWQILSQLKSILSRSGIKEIESISEIQPKNKKSGLWVPGQSQT